MTFTEFACALVLATVATSGCVSKGKYDEAIAKTQITQAELDRTSASLAQANAQIEKEHKEIARLEWLESLIAELSTASRTDRESSEANLAALHASSEANLAALRKQLEELKSTHAAAEVRAALFRDVALRLKQQIDAGDLTITVRDGRMVLQLPNDVLFDTGRTELKPAGQASLGAIASVLVTMPKRHFQIAGHTDKVAIRNARFASNWELSSGRALRVVHFLIDKGVAPGMLSAAGYGEMDPVAENTTREGRQRNRRTEITLQPNIDEMVRLP